MDSLATNADSYQHEPLVDPKTHIRLLKITEGRVGQGVACTLTTWPLEIVPPYTAISYTWGDPKRLATISINGRPNVVRRNCEYVLHQAWGVNPNDLYWVDALCIDQSLTEEKNHQVAMMGDLYKRATRVLACVGEHSGDSEFLMRILETHKAYLTRRNLDVILDNRDSELDWTGQSFQIEKSRYFQDVLVRAKLRKDRGRIVLAYTQILKRPYFSRVWILQELYAGSGRITICCGLSHQPLAILFVLGLLVDRWLQLPGRIDYVIHRLLGLFLSSAHRTDPDMELSYWRQWVRKASLTAGSGALKHPMRLPWLLRSMDTFECEDPRDRIYGIRYLVDWEGQAPPFPDYSKDVFSLAVEVMSMIHAQLRRRFITRHDWIECPILTLAGNLISLLDFSLESVLLRDAIRRRRPGLIRQYQMPQSYAGPKKGEFMWCGETLGSDYQLDECDTHVEIRDRRDQIRYFGPKDTRLGDWFLSSNDEPQTRSSINFWKREAYATHYSWDHALVIRVAQNGVCSVIGPAFNPQSWHEPVKLQNPKFFVFWWDPEDILMLEWRYSQYDKHEEVAKQIDNCFGLRATVSPDSTMVKGPFEPEEIQAEISKGAERMFLESDYKDWRR
ncbi:heterokaryon incompatibility protein-domain-containing protein [Paraphoma chrysanthemicola]|uniref:Heterokaryon incompatibility protein-domain-containing protein n=1 Tax=Paraphoma chrysanthemicola TaxID=798071 RepID=A0A8K0W5F6_9PLEO|nr:heterokaryon incompatibility protein-domain-containing protein [Paraphoma chrysanthemicola]